MKIYLCNANLCDFDKINHCDVGFILKQKFITGMRIYKLVMKIYLRDGNASLRFMIKIFSFNEKLTVWWN